jgi:flagellar protein FliL
MAEMARQKLPCGKTLKVFVNHVRRVSISEGEILLVPFLTGHFMAKKKKPEAAEDEEGVAAPEKSKKKLFMIGGAAALVLALAGGGYYFFMGGDSKAAKMTAEGGGHNGPGAMVELEEMKISLAAEPGEARQAFLKMKVTLEVADAEVAKQVEPLMPRIVDSFQVFMRELRPNELEGSAGFYRLKEEMMRRVNVAVYPNKVEAINFKEFLVQ